MLTTRHNRKICRTGLEVLCWQVKRLKERLGEVEGAVAQLRGAGAAEAAGDPSPDPAAEVAKLREPLATTQAEAAAAAAQRDSLQHEAAQLRSQVLTCMQ